MCVCVCMRVYVCVCVCMYVFVCVCHNDKKYDLVAGFLIVFK